MTSCKNDISPFFLGSSTNTVWSESTCGLLVGAVVAANLADPQVRNEELVLTREKVRGLEQVSRAKEQEVKELQVSLQQAHQQNLEKTRVLDSLQVQLAGQHRRLSMVRNSIALNVRFMYVQKNCITALL